MEKGMYRVTRADYGFKKNQIVEVTATCMTCVWVGNVEIPIETALCMLKRA